MGLGSLLKNAGNEIKSLNSSGPRSKQLEKENLRRDQDRRRENELRLRYPDHAQDGSDPTSPQNAQDIADSQDNLEDFASSSGKSFVRLAEAQQGSWYSAENGQATGNDPSPDSSGMMTGLIRQNIETGNRASYNDASHQKPRGNRPEEASIDVASGSSFYSPLNPQPLFAEKPRNGATKLSKGVDDAFEAKARDRIFKQLHKLKEEYASIKFKEKLTKPLSLVQVDMALDTLIDAFTSLSRTASDMKTNHAEQIRALNDKLEKAEKENLRKIGQLEGKMEEREKGLGDQLKKQRSENEVITKNYKTQIRDLENEVRRLKDKLHTESTNLSQQHKQQLVVLETKISQAVAKNEAENAQWKVYCDGLEAKLTKEFNEKLRLKETEYQNMKKAADEAVSKAKQDREVAVSTRHRDIENVKAAWRKDVAEVKAEWKNEVAGLMNEWKTEVTGLKTAHEADKAETIKGLQESVEELKTALVKRDHFKAMSDREVANKFREVNTYVDDFARAAYPWDESKMPTWPFQAHELRNSGNDRRTKQNIIHNTLWAILFDMIFCTPFRMFGKEGRNLEFEWIKQYGDGLRFSQVPCPKPSKESEKSRYETIKTCVEAINRTTRNGGDFSYRTKQGYESTLKEASEEMSFELERVTSLDSEKLQRLDDLVKKATKMWLEVGQQRCRMFLFMSEAGEEKPMRSGPAALDQNRSMNLVITPELRRYGNSQGEKLEKHELVLDCKGKFSAFHSS